MSEICGYDEPWIGYCKNEKPCAKHKDEKCKCGKPAIGGCLHTGMFVCGQPLCEDCKCNH